MAHYYVRVDALGETVQDRLDLNLEVLNDAGYPLSVGGSNAVPARLGADATLATIGQTNTVTLHPRRLLAHRLSPDRSDPLHTVYLAGPFVLVDTTFSASQAMQVQAQLPRNLVRAGRHLWVGIDPASVSGALPLSFLSKPSGGRLLPGVSARANIIHDERPLVLIPGIAGSHLENTNSWTSFLLSERWPAYLRILQEELNLDPADRQFPIAASDILRQIPEDYNVGPGGILPLLGVQKGVYQALIEYLIHELGYVEYNYIKAPGELVASAEDFAPRRTVDGMVPEEIARGPNLFVFPYDWRLDNAKNAESLREYVKVIRAVHPGADKIDLVAHSMGGLVARRFILDNPGVVDRCITIGTPFLGAPKAIAALETGDFDDAALNFIIIKPLLKKLAEYFPAVHQLLPSQGYFDLGGRPLGEAGWDFDGDGATGERYDYENYKFVMDSVFHTKTNTWPVATNELFHAYRSPAQPVNRQDDWSQDATGVEYFHIYGVESVANTIGEVRLSRTLRPVEPPPDLRIDLPSFQSTERDVALPLSDPFLTDDVYVMYPRLDLVRVRGDGTVPELSASRMAAGENWNAPGARLLKVESHALEDDELASHNGMLANPQVQQWIGEILRGGEPLVAGSVAVSSTGPAPFVHVEIVNAVDGSAYAVESSTGKSSKGNDVAGSLAAITDVVKVVPFLPGFADGDKNVQSVEFSIAGDDAYDLFFEAGEQPVSVIIRSGADNEVTDKAVHRDIVYDPGTVVTVHVPGGGAAPTITPPGNEHAGRVALTSSAADNEQAPGLDYDLDGDVTQVMFTPFDDVTAPDQMPVFGAYDDGDDREIDSELIYRLPGQRIAIDSLESGRFYGLTMDGAGNLSEPGEVTRKPPAPVDCDLLDAKRAAILDVIEQGLEIARNDGWLLDFQHVSILEQGSGACLWQRNYCTICTDVYDPKESDHDYEVFLRVFVNGVPANFTADPHAPANREGDWYFKPPVLAGNQWEYTRPDGSKMVQPSSAKPQTPAQIITRTLNQAVVLLGYDQPDPALTVTYPILPDISFFPVRYDHFTNAVLDLEPPPQDGDDPIGDAGLGRQMLLLKWVLEGVYVPVTSPPIDPGYNLDAVFQLMKSRGDLGIPSLEGYEWAQLQLYAALSSGLMLRVENPNEAFDPDELRRNSLYNLKRRQIKKAGKAAIRASLAQIAGRNDPDRASLLFSVDRQEMRDLNIRSFEEVIAFLAKQQPGLFGPFVDRLDDFLSAKLAEPAFVDQLATNGCALNQFLADAMNLLFKVNQDTRLQWEQEVVLLPANEQFFRTNNIQRLRNGFPPPGIPGLTEYLDEASVTLPVRLINDSDAAVEDLAATMTVGGGPPVIFTTNLAARGHATLSLGPFTITRSLTDGTPQPVLLTVTAPQLMDEVRTANNWIGLESYILDLANPCNIPHLDLPSPSGVPPGDPEAAHFFRRTAYFDPGFEPQGLANAFAAHFGQLPQRIYVVGSRMLGAADANSDIDVIFVTDLVHSTGERLRKGDDEAFPFFKAINPHLTIPLHARHLGNAAQDPEAVEIGDPTGVADPDQKARTLPKRGVIDPFFETIYEVNRFGFLVWPD